MNRTLSTAAVTVLLVGALTACSHSTQSKAARTSTASTSSPAETEKTTAPAAPGATDTAAKKPPAAQARKQAAAILKKEDQAFRDFLAQGENAIGTPQWLAWVQKATAGLDMKQTAFSKADALFTADDEPTDLIEQWRNNNGDANLLITQFANDGGPELTVNTRKDASQARAALKRADMDAQAIANGS